MEQDNWEEQNNQMEEEGNQEYKPQVKSGWGLGIGQNQQASNIGMNKKSNAAQYWDAKTTELVIPEIDVEGAIEDVSGGY